MKLSEMPMQEIEIGVTRVMYNELEGTVIGKGWVDGCPQVCIDWGRGNRLFELLAHANYLIVVTAENRMWRTLVQIESVRDNGVVGLIVPAWHAVQTIYLHKTDFPENIRESIIQGQRFHTHVNIGAEHVEDLHFEKWEEC